MTTPPINSFGASDTDPMAEEVEHEDEFVQLANLGQAPGQDRIYGEPKPAEESSRPLTSDDLAAIMSAFQKTVSDALASQQADFEKRLASGALPEPGKLLAAKGPGDADSFSTVPAKRDEVGSGTSVKSTLQVPSGLRLRMKAWEISNRTSAQRLTIAAIEEFLAKRGF